jgi:hypothetical protein
MSDRIELTDQQDIAFTSMATGANVTGATLPSGLRIPKTGTWIVISRGVIMKRELTG